MIFSFSTGITSQEQCRSFFCACLLVLSRAGRALVLVPARLRNELLTSADGSGINSCPRGMHRHHRAARGSSDQRLISSTAESLLSRRVACEALRRLPWQRVTIYNSFTLTVHGLLRDDPHEGGARGTGMHDTAGTSASSFSRIIDAVELEFPQNLSVGTNAEASVLWLWSHCSNVRWQDVQVA